MNNSKHSHVMLALFHHTYGISVLTDYRRPLKAAALTNKAHIRGGLTDETMLAPFTAVSRGLRYDWKKSICFSPVSWVHLLMHSSIKSEAKCRPSLRLMLLIGSISRRRTAIQLLPCYFKHFFFWLYHENDCNNK